MELKPASTALPVERTNGVHPWPLRRTSQKCPQPLPSLNTAQFNTSHAKCNIFHKSLIPEYKLQAAHILHATEYLTFLREMEVRRRTAKARMCTSVLRYLSTTPHCDFSGILVHWFLKSESWKLKDSRSPFLLLSEHSRLGSPALLIFQWELIIFKEHETQS